MPALRPSRWCFRRIEGGGAVLERVRQTRDDIAATGAKGRAAVDILVRDFALNRDSRRAARGPRVCQRMGEKAITKTREIAELLDYLEYFREARGVIPLSSSDDDAVPLMTAHAAKGLEFPHVFILRANSGSFPLNYQEAAD